MQGAVMNAKNFFILNKRVLILVLTGLLMLESVISLVISQRFARPEGQRLPAYDEATLGLWIDQVKKAGGYKVVLIGDSVIHGHAVESSFETLPAYVARELRERLPGREIRVFNLGMAGAAPADVYFLLDALLEGAGVNLVIYNINVSWFAPRENTLEHTSLLKLKDTPPDFDLQSLGIQTAPTATPAENWLYRHVLSRWKLYRYRILLNYWLFGKPLRDKLEEAQTDSRLLLPFAEDRLPEVVEERSPWWEKEWEGKLDPASGRIGTVSLDDGNRQWIFYRKLLDLIKDKSIPAVFFVTPHNYELLDRYDMVDRRAYAKNLSAIAGAAGASGVPVLDYDSALSGRDFSDIVHPLPEGNRLLARLLVQDLVEKGIIKR
jgi:hypothetical protein